MTNKIAGWEAAGAMMDELARLGYAVDLHCGEYDNEWRCEVHYSDLMTGDAASIRQDYNNGPLAVQTVYNAMMKLREYKESVKDG